MLVRTISLLLLLVGTCSCRTVHQPVSREVFTDTFSTSPHSAKLLVSGRDALIQRIALIRSARESIVLQTFIWTADECGKLIFFELAEAAKRGVKVRLICDYMYVAGDPDLIAAASRVPGLEMRLYNPMSPDLQMSKTALAGKGVVSLGKLNKRMHNKMMVIDKRAGICGGRNIENTYFGESLDMNFKDLEILVKGSVVEQMANSFDDFWNSELSKDVREFNDVKESIAEERYKKYDINKVKSSELYQRIDKTLSEPETIASLKSGFSLVDSIAFCSDDPGKNAEERSLKGSSQFNEILVYSVLNAKRSVWIQSPYLILSPRAKRVFKHIRKTTPDLDIRISSNSMASTDNWLAYAYLYRGKQFLVDELEIGLYEFNPLPGDLYEYFPNYGRVLQARTGKTSLDAEMIRTVPPREHPFLCIHAKCMVIDDHLSFIGSYNIDPRSANLNTELGIVIDDLEFAKIMRAYFEKDFLAHNSWPVWTREHPLPSRIVQLPIEAVNTAVKTTTSLDLWPDQNCACFELKKGRTPTHPSHPDFHQNYTPAGNFPRVPPNSMSLIYARTLKAVGRFAQPLM